MNKKEAVNKLFDHSTIGIDEIVNELGVTRATFAYWRNGTSNPKKQYLNKLAQILGHRVKWLNNDECELIKAESNVSQPFKVPIDEDRKIPVITEASAGLFTYPEVIQMTDTFIRVPK